MITIKLFEDTSAEQAKINCHLEESGGHADKSGLGPGVFNGPTPPPDTAKVLVNVFGPNTICTRHKSWEKPVDQEITKQELIARHVPKKYRFPFFKGAAILC
jgi:hypothetical protein